MLDQLATEGVDVSAVVVRDDMPTGMTVALSRGGDRAILTALGAVASLTAADVPASLLAGARHVHASSWFLLEDSPRPRPGRAVFRGPGGGRHHVARHQLGSGRTMDRRAPGRRDRPGRPAAAQRGRSAPAEQRALPGRGAPGSSPLPGPRLVVKLGERGALCADGPARAPGQPAARHPGRHHRRGRLLQRRPDRRAPRRHGPAPGRRPRLRRRRPVHRRPRRHRQPPPTAPPPSA